jgi:hypothetical protein
VKTSESRIPLAPNRPAIAPATLADLVSAAVDRPVDMCSRCKRELVPRLAVNSLRRDMWRAPADGMATAPDPKAERIRARKDRKERRSVATLAATIGITGPMTFSLSTAALAPATPADEECPDCIRRRNRTAARLALRLGSVN